MQSSYSLIKKNLARQGQSKIISTEYDLKRSAEPIIEEEIKEKPYVDPEEVLKRYEEIGKRLIEDAKREKQAMMLKAQMVADKAEKDAYEKGYSQGQQNGYDDGYKEGEAKAYAETIEVARVEAEEIRRNSEILLRSAKENYEMYLDDKKKEIIDLALEIANGICKKVLVKSDSMNELIEEAFKVSKKEENVIIKTSEVHVEELKKQVDRWKIVYGVKNEIFILSDNEIEPGNAILEKTSGIVKVGIDAGMDQIKKAIFNE